MITNEQIKNLKPGDPLIVHGKFDSIFKGGDIGIRVDITCGYGEGGGVTKDIKYVHPSCVSLPSVKPIEPCYTTKIPEQPKHDPCRKFRTRDKVRVKREVNGRPVYIGDNAWEPADPSEIWTVVKEKDTGWVYLKNGRRSVDVWHGMLELVTPVEELEPYCVMKYSSFYAVERHNNLHDRPATYDIDFHPYAKKAAEAERDRLNAEHRKENI